MKTNKITLTLPGFLLYMLIAFIVGAVIYRILSPDRRLNYADTQNDSRISKLEARDAQIEAQAEQQSKIVWAGYGLQLAGLFCQMFGKFCP